MFDAMTQSLLSRAPEADPLHNGAMLPQQASSGGLIQALAGADDKGVVDPKSQQVMDGFRAFQALAAKAKAENDANPNIPKKPEAPPVDTSGLIALLTSLKDRAKYAIYGPPVAPKEGQK